MARSDGYQPLTTPIHKTNNLLLRWFANYISSPISYRYLSKSLRIYFRDEDGIETMTPKLERRMNRYSKLYRILGLPYDKWGTTYLLNTEVWLKEMKKDQVLERLGSDYDENGIPYWEKNEDKTIDLST